MRMSLNPNKKAMENKNHVYGKANHLFCPDVLNRRLVATEA